MLGKNWLTCHGWSQSPKRGVVAHLVRQQKMKGGCSITCVGRTLDLEHLTRILGDVTNSIERIGMQWKEKSPTIVAAQSRTLEMLLRSPATMVDAGLASGEGHGGTGHVVAWLLGGHAQNFQSQLHVLCETGLFLRPQTAGQEG